LKQYKVAIIGAGSIGANKPEHIDYPNSPNILTHANAVDRHITCELMAIVDNDPKQLMKAKEKWNPLVAVGSYNDLVLGHGAPDIVILAVPTKYHYETLLQIFMTSQLPKLIIAEKPFCETLTEAEEMMSAYNDEGVQIAIDYIRRYATKYQEIKKQIDNNEFGKVQNARVIYTRGLRHEGCHGIDLMRYFLGEVKFCGGTKVNSIIDRDENDPTIYAKFRFEKCPHVTFEPCDGRMYGIFEIDICFENCRLRFIDNGLQVERYPINQENEWGHKSLDYGLSNVLRTETGLGTALYNLIDNCVNFLSGKEELVCTANDAVAVHKVLDELK